MYLFRFTNRFDINKVLRCGPWRFNEYFLATKEVSPRSIVPKSELHMVDFWLQVYGIPVFRQTEEMVRYVGSHLSEVVDAEPHLHRQDGVGQLFMRVRVVLDVNNKLPRGTTLKMGNPNPLLYFKCERLFNFCLWCGKVNHVREDCAESLKPGFFIWLTVAWGVATWHTASTAA